MARIDDLLLAGPTYSFEFFPPRTPEAEEALSKALVELEPLHPSFVSVTYGAGGSTREKTREIVVDILERGAMTPMAHLTCAGHARSELIEIVEGYANAGVENLLALAGDPPADAGPDFVPGDLTHAFELVALIRRHHPSAAVGVAAHPELHPRSPDRASDRRHLAEKLDLADFGVGQFFFRAEDYFAMVEDVAALGVTKPIIPGIMPVTNLAQIQRFAQLSGTLLPAPLIERLEAVGDDPVAVRQVGVEAAIELCAELLDRGVPGLHFYTLNRSTATREIYAALGLS